MRRRPELTAWATWIEAKGDYVIRWLDPVTGRIRQHAAHTTRKRDADRQAVDKEAELANPQDARGVRWSVVRDRYLREVLAYQKDIHKWHTAMNRLEDMIGPRYLVDINADLASRFLALLREEDPPLSVETIRDYWAELRRTINWAATIWQDFSPPTVRPPRGRKNTGMKGRPITREEFERMLESLPGVERIPPDCRDGWEHFLEGLWLSGLRLGEGLKLSWDDTSTIRVQSLDHRRPKLAIPAEDDKGNQDRLFSTVPEFADFLRETPESERRGLVFSPNLAKGRASYNTAGKSISALGQLAGVVVHRGAGGKVKFASAHDFRRAFGTRLALRISRPVVLMHYMRHKSIQTTMKYYIGIDADDAADSLWRAARPELRDQLRDHELYRED